MDAIVRLTQEIGKLWRAVRKLQVTGFQRPVWLTTPLTSAAWDGDAYSTTAKTLIDLSAVFSAPANIKAALFRVGIRDSGSAGSLCYIILAPDATASQGPAFSIESVPNDIWRYTMMLVPCDANGDVYYEVTASGASALDVVLQIWGYWL